MLLLSEESLFVPAHPLCTPMGPLHAVTTKTNQCRAATTELLHVRRQARRTRSGSYKVATDTAHGSKRWRQGGRCHFQTAEPLHSYQGTPCCPPHPPRWPDHTHSTPTQVSPPPPSHKRHKPHPTPQSTPMPGSSLSAPLVHVYVWQLAVCTPSPRLCLAARCLALVVLGRCLQTPTPTPPLGYQWH